MDTMYLIVSALTGILEIQTVFGTLRCIECEHISWNPDVTFEGSNNVYLLLQSKYNPACAQENPNDRNMSEQNQQSANPQIGGQFANRYDISETICPVLSNQNRCQYIYGNVEVYLPSYNARIYLNMHVRNCIDVSPDMENWCYDRDTTHGYYDIRNFFQDKLGFLGNAKVVTFRGRQCYCAYNLCYPYVNSSTTVTASSLYTSSSTTVTASTSTTVTASSLCTSSSTTVTASTSTTVTASSLYTSSSTTVTASTSTTVTASSLYTILQTALLVLTQSK